MVLDFSALSAPAILVALVAHMILGAAWFGVFADAWASRAHPGKTHAQLQAGPKWIYGVAAAGGLVTAIVLAGLLHATGATSLPDAMILAALLWLGFVAAHYATTYAFEYRSWTLWAIDVGYPLVSLLAMATILTLWP